MTELSSEVVALHYNQETGRFNELATVSALPSEFDGDSYGSAIHLSADGRFVYVANRGHNSIACFKIDAESGKLAAVEHTATGGDWPRDFVLDPTGTYLIAANQNSNTLVLFGRDAETGRLELLQADVHVPEPVCVTFLNK